MARLVFKGGRFDGRVYEFAVERNTVGRGSQNTLVIHDDSVSSAHCEILVFGTEVIVRDLGSSNGTFVNGVRLHNQQREAKSGQIVKFGDVEARLEMEEPFSEGTTTDITAAYAFGRFVRDQQKAPPPPVAAPFTFGSSPESASTDHTTVLSRPTQAAEANPPPPPQKPLDATQPARMLAVFFAIAALVLGLALLAWLIWGRD